MHSPRFHKGAKPMKRSLYAVLAVFALASLAWATDYTISTGTARQDQILNQHRVILNTDTCSAARLPANCTQAQARAVNPGANVYTTVADYIQRYHGPKILAEAKADIAAHEAEALCRWWNNSTTTRAAQDGVCTAIGLTAGCELCN
jgi:hypothetical protein